MCVYATTVNSPGLKHSMVLAAATGAGSMFHSFNALGKKGAIV